MSKPKLSIVVTTHCRPTLLQRALNSLLARGEKDYEIILCSDDEDTRTFEVALGALRSCDSFLRIPKMRGPSESRNIGVSVARGEWVCFLDDDDSFGESHLDTVLGLISRKDQCVCFFNYMKITECRKLDNPVLLEQEFVDLSENKIDTLLVSNFIPINSMVIPRGIFSRHQFDPHLESLEDWDFLVSLLLNGIDFQWSENVADSVRVHIDSAGRSRNFSPHANLDLLSA